MSITHVSFPSVWKPPKSHKTDTTSARSKVRGTPTSSPQISIEEDISVCSSDKKKVEAHTVLLGSPTTATCLICEPCVGISAEAQVRPCFSCVDCLFFFVASEIDPGQVPACRNYQERHLLISILFSNIPIKVGSADYLSKLAGDKQHAHGSI